MAGHESTRVILIALAANLGIAVAKFAAAAITGSSAMLTEGIHSTVDSANEVLLLYGTRQSERPPDRTHPFGYGRELYFWSFVVAILVFALGAGVSFYEGVRHLLHPRPGVRCDARVRAQHARCRRDRDPGEPRDLGQRRAGGASGHGRPSPSRVPR